MNLTQKYGKTALIAGASECIGAAFATYLAASGMDMILIARRPEPLQELADALMKKYEVSATCISCDLSDPDAAQNLLNNLKDIEINLFVYNAALPYIGAFENSTTEYNGKMAATNMVTPMHLVHALGKCMLEKGKGAVILMASLAGFQGSGYLSVYAATKAFNRIFAESLWYEWKDCGIDVLACCAGATATPGFINTHPEKTSLFAPKVQTPEAVVEECFQQLGKSASFVTGSGNKLASFIMQRLMPRKLAITIMGDTTKKMYRL
ncbi:MAG: short-chain dehydrogenase [Bacteroidota bacterium]|nr:short-chain dehydrogenase [Bacteroidota bacterium]